MKVAGGTQHRLVTEPDALTSFEPILAAIMGQIRSLEAKITEAIDDDPLWAEFNRVFRTIKGVTDRSVVRLAAEMPEIGTLPSKAGKRPCGQRNQSQRLRPAK